MKSLDEFVGYYNALFCPPKKGKAPDLTYEPLSFREATASRNQLSFGIVRENQQIRLFLRRITTENAFSHPPRSAESEFPSKIALKCDTRKPHQPSAEPYPQTRINPEVLFYDLPRQSHSLGVRNDLFDCAYRSLPEVVLELLGFRHSFDPEMTVGIELDFSIEWCRNQGKNRIAVPDIRHYLIVSRHEDELGVCRAFYCSSVLNRFRCVVDILYGFRYRCMIDGVVQDFRSLFCRGPAVIGTDEHERHNTDNDDDNSGDNYARGIHGVVPGVPIGSGRCNRSCRRTK